MTCSRVLCVCAEAGADEAAHGAGAAALHDARCRQVLGHSAEEDGDCCQRYGQETREAEERHYQQSALRLVSVTKLKP